MTFPSPSVILGCATDVGAFFLCANFLTLEFADERKCGQRFFYRSLRTKKMMEVEVVRVKITLACTDCKQRNYNLTKDKRVHTERMELKKYCRFCKAHTLHKETK